MGPPGQISPAGMGSNNHAGEQRQGCRPVVRLVCHRAGAAALRLGMGPDLRPVGALGQLQHLLNRNAFWAGGRSLGELRTMLRNSAVCVSAWQGDRLVGFGRATSDGVFRGTIWDLVVDGPLMGQGIGRAILQKLLLSRALAPCERVYLMTTNSADFYTKMGFRINTTQVLMIREKSG